MVPVQQTELSNVMGVWWLAKSPAGLGTLLMALLCCFFFELELSAEQKP